MILRRVGVALVGAAAVGLLASCGAPSAGPVPAPSSAFAQEGLPVLSPAALPGLAARTRTLPAAELAKDTSIADVRAQLSADGYLGGRERTFQGPSRHLTFVASRTLAFRDAPGAAAFLSYLHRHADAWFGGATQALPIVSSQRSGYVFEPPMCSCHLANPVLVGVVQEGSRLAWLEINGPDATKALLLDLMVPSHEEAT